MEHVLLGILGLCIGSFLNVAILRLPKGESVSLPASHCPICHNNLKWYHNIPLLSWICLRGKCAFCKTSISYQYPLIELLTALIYLFCSFYLHNFIEALLLGTIFSLLLALSLIDFRYKAVPDALSMPALFLSFFVGHPLEALQNGLIFMGAFCLLRFTLSMLMKKEALGEADIIIVGIMGAILGIKLGCAAIYIAAVIAMFGFFIVRKKGYELPFIPFLSLGLLVAWLFDTPILNFVEHLYE